MKEKKPPVVTGYCIEDDRRVGDDGFLTIRRMRLRTQRDDGSRSEIFLSDYVERKKGLDAVAVGLYTDDQQVLLRAGLRPALHYGRRDVHLAVPDARPYLLFTEIVAGLIEKEDHGEEGLRRRAAAEAWEEAGFRLTSAQLQRLGPAVFLSPGLCAERVHFFIARVDPAWHSSPEGDGSPMEEGATQRFVPLPEALRMCDAGQIEDCKTEILLRRLAAHLK